MLFLRISKPDWHIRSLKIAVLTDAPALSAYDEEKDYRFFQVRDYSTLSMPPGMVCVLFPADVHAPGLDSLGKGLIKKTVVKVRMNPYLR